MSDYPDVNPFYSAALESETVKSGLTFSLEQVVMKKDAGLCYSEQLIRAAAAAKRTEQDQCARKLKLLFGKDFNKPEWFRQVRDAEAELKVAGPARGLIQGENGATKPILANAVIELGSVLNLGYDTFSMRVELLEPSPWGTVGPWRDADARAATEWLQHRGVCCGTAIGNEAAIRLSETNTFNSMLNTLDAMEWDGEHRLDSWMSDYLGVVDNPYTRAVAAAWCISGVARIYRPGCKADSMLLLEGAQGKRKSMAIRALVNGHLDADKGVQRFGDDPPDISDKDINLYMRGLWIVELAEMDAIRGKEWSKVKRFLSTQRDTFRAPYGYNMESHPRQSIFCGSTNETNYLSDPSGGRRIWPVRVGEIDVKGLMAASGQIWAETVERYKDGAKWWLDDEAEGLARAEQAERMPDDPHLEWVGDILTGEHETSLAFVMDKLAEKKGVDKHKVKDAMSKLGWESYRSTDPGRPRRYRRVEE